MKLLNVSDLCRELCRLTNKWGIWIRHDALSDNFELTDSTLSDLHKAAPYLSQDGLMKFWYEEFVFLLCDSEEEAFDKFYRTVGDDGPTKLNSYAGPVKVYCCVYNSHGKAVTENT